MRHIVIDTERLRISPRSIAEMEALRLAERDPEMIKAYGEMTDTMRALPGREEWGCEWRIELKDSKVTVGGICLKGVPDAAGRVEIGYGIEAAHRLRGYATEAAHAMALWALSEPDCVCVTAQTEPDNAASQAVLLRAGFVRDGDGDEGPMFSIKK